MQDKKLSSKYFTLSDKIPKKLLTYTKIKSLWRLNI